MGLIDRWMTKLGLDQRAVRERFGADVVEKLRDKVILVRAAPVRDDPPFFWIEAGERSFVGDIEMRGVDGLRALLEQGVTSGEPAEALIRRAAGHAQLPLYDDRQRVARDVNGPFPPTDAMTYWVAADQELLARFEPPHFEGRAFVFFAQTPNFRRLAAARGHAPPDDVVRVVIDTQSWSVIAERICDAAQLCRRGVKGRALIGDDGGVITAARLLSSTQRAQAWRDAALSE
ncbi:MAG: hypothetical protein Q8O67_33960, partial [Deltaproteobacteria bacterium]|nr:hypothetical protein [Deltaproteobacteria bacterium]